MILDRSARYRLARKARVRWDTRNQKDMLLYPERGLLLNDVGSRIVSLCDGTRDFAGVVRELSAAFPGVATDVLERDAETFVEKLLARGLLEAVP